MKNAKEKGAWGGKREGAGRPKTTDHVLVGIRLSPEDRQRLKELGGSAWIREQIRNASKITKTDSFAVK